MVLSTYIPVDFCLSGWSWIWHGDVVSTWTNCSYWTVLWCILITGECIWRTDTWSSRFISICVVLILVYGCISRFMKSSLETISILWRSRVSMLLRGYLGSCSIKVWSILSQYCSFEVCSIIAPPRRVDHWIQRRGAWLLLIVSWSDCHKFKSPARRRVVWGFTSSPAGWRLDSSLAAASSN